MRVPKTIKYVYKKSDNYRSTYANGVYGGLTAQGELKFDFFQEYKPVPEEEIRDIHADENADEEVIKESSELVMIRERKMGITMTPDIARSVANWILGKLEDLEKIQAKKSGEEK